MKTEEEIRERIKKHKEVIQKIRKSYNSKVKAHDASLKVKRRIGELEWVLEEDSE